MLKQHHLSSGLDSSFKFINNLPMAESYLMFLMFPFCFQFKVFSNQQNASENDFTASLTPFYHKARQAFCSSYTFRTALSYDG